MNSVRAEAVAQARATLNGLKQCKVSMQIKGKDFKVGFRREGNKHLIADLHERNLPIGVNDLRRLPRIMGAARYKASADNADGKTHMGISNIVKFHYFRAEVRGKKFFINVAERKLKRNKKELFLYSMTDKLKK